MKYARQSHLQASAGRRRRASGFTLVELLTVMVIIAVLSTIILGSVRGLSGSGNRRSAISRLMGVLDQARMLAIAENRAVYVVFASPLPGQTPAPQISASMWGRAYAIFQDKSDFKPVQRSAWMYLPVGVAFKSSGNDGLTALTNQPFASGDGTNFPLSSMVAGVDSTEPDKGAKLPYLKFDPVGSLVDYKGGVVEADSPTARLLLFDGSVTSSGVETSTRRISASDTDSQKRNIDEVDIKPITGRAKYVLDPLDNLVVSASPAS
jgi:prepilin-type N-terminal cleavage/methylation domain-containing protein